MNTAPQPVAYTIPECAAALRVSPRTIRRAIAAGQLGPVIRIGRLVRVSQQSLLEFLDRSAKPETRDGHS